MICENSGQVLLGSTFAAFAMLLDHMKVWIEEFFWILTGHLWTQFLLVPLKIIGLKNSNV